MEFQVYLFYDVYVCIVGWFFLYRFYGVVCGVYYGDGVVYGDVNCDDVYGDVVFGGGVCDVGCGGGCDGVYGDVVCGDGVFCDVVCDVYFCDVFCDVDFCDDVYYGGVFCGGGDVVVYGGVFFYVFFFEVYWYE